MDLRSGLALQGDSKLITPVLGRRG
jgi:hypothetical protein